jgi:small GTP-binding protein
MSIHISSKVILVGESNVGKSCLAQRLATNRYEEQGTTHGMRIWSVSPEQLSPNAVTPSGEKREIEIWDMGGQDEYRLIHQLFFNDASLILVLVDPTRGRTAFQEVEAWNLRLEKQLEGRKRVKLLVGTKLDSGGAVDLLSLERLIKDFGFAGYYPTSAKTGMGVSELSSAVCKAIDWEALTKVIRPALFQSIRDEVMRRRAEGEVTLSYSDFEEQIRRDVPDKFDPQLVNAVVEQLALQGVIATIRRSSGERVLVLQVGELERYAGSLIIAARNNPRGVPVLEERLLTSSKMSFSGIPKGERLPRVQEQMVLECVVQLLLEHGICLKHQGLLIFPSLFQSSKYDDSSDLPYSISLYYDFSGAVDNVYSSLVALLAVSENFGRLRLWEDRAEFEKPKQGLCGLRSGSRPNGLTRLDIFFSEETSRETRALFVLFVEDHLRKHGISIAEGIDVTCSCGYTFLISSIRKRLALGYGDIICPECETRNRISEGANRIRHDNPDVEKNLLALRTSINEKLAETVSTFKRGFEESEHVGFIDITTPIRILHLSDLHLRHDENLSSILQPLLEDIEGVGFPQLDYLVISGDLSSRATREEFEHAYQFISRLIERFNLTAERCIIVPGNHDLSWDEPSYGWRPKRLVDVSELESGTYFEQGNGILVRDDNKYPLRFDNFARFYHSLTQQQYPLRPEEQCIPHLFTDTGIQFLPLNSAWEVDEFFPYRASINPAALSRGLIKADEQIERLREFGKFSDKSNLLRIAVWHHPVSGNEKMKEDIFLDRLRKENVQLCLHGGVHDAKAEAIGYLHPNRRIYVTGAGSFTAPAFGRSEIPPRLYNLLEVSRDLSKIRIHTRALLKDGSAWNGWAVWPGQNPNERRTYYDINLQSLAKPKFDVFLCHSSADKEVVKQIGGELKERGLLPWLDEWELRPGLPWQRALEEQIDNIKSVAVFVGGQGASVWENREQESFLRHFIKNKRPVIPVILPGSEVSPRLPLYLQGVTSVDFRNPDSNPIEQLIWGINGVRRKPSQSSIRDSQSLADIDYIRQALGDDTFSDFTHLARTIFRRIGATDVRVIKSSYFNTGTLWEISIPNIGLVFRRQQVLLFLRQKEGDRPMELRLSETTKRRGAVLLFVVDVADITSSPVRICPQTVWLTPESLMEMVLAPAKDLPSWLGRFITKQIDVSVRQGLLPYQTSGKASLFVGREYEMARLTGGTPRGGIIIGAHRSGKSSLLDQLGKGLRNDGYTVIGPHTVAVETFRPFFELTLSALDIEIPRELTPQTWATALKEYSKQNKRPIFLLDEIDELIKLDCEAEFTLGHQMRSLQNDGSCLFYLAGHARLRDAISLEGGPFRNFAEEVILTGLTRTAAMRLIQEPIKQIGFNITDAQAQRIFKGTAGVAVLIQEFCIRLLLNLDQTSAPQIKDSAISDVECSPAYLDVVFKHYKYGQDWKAMSAMLITAIGGVATRGDITRGLEQSGIFVERDRLDEVLEFLITFGVLEEFEGGSFRILSGYLSRAIEAREPTSLLKAEIKKGRAEVDYD